MAIRLSKDEFKGVGCLLFVLSIIFTILGIAMLFMEGEYGEGMENPLVLIIGGIIGALIFRKAM